MNSMLMLLIFNLLMFIITGLWMAYLPKITHQELLFGVRIPESVVKNPEVKSLHQDYQKRIILLTLFILMIQTLQYLFQPEWTLLSTLYLVLIFTLGGFAIYISNWKVANRLKEKNGWYVSDRRVAEIKVNDKKTVDPIFCFWIFMILSPTIIANLFQIVFYDKIPDPIPTHWNFYMIPDAFEPKTPASVLKIIMLTMGTIVLLIIGFVSVKRQKMQINPNHPKKSFAQQKIYRQRILRAYGAVSVGTSWLFALIIFQQLGLIQIRGTLGSLLLSVLILLPSVYLVFEFIRNGQGGNKIPVDPNLQEDEKILQEIQIKNAGDDRYWKWGLFYYNPDDPTLFVEDRFGTNIGLNYARTSAKIFVAIMVGIILGTYLWVTMLFFQGALI